MNRPRRNPGLETIGSILTDPVNARLTPQERAAKRLQRLMAHMAAKERKRDETLRSIEVLKKNDKETHK